MIDRKQLAAMIKDHMLSGRAPSQAMAWTREDWEAIIDALTSMPEARTSNEALIAAFDAGASSAGGRSDPWKDGDFHSERERFIASLTMNNGGQS